VAIAEQAAGILAVFGLLAIAVWALGRKSGRLMFVFRSRTKPEGGMAVADRLVLTPQHSLHLVRVGDRTVLLATHPQGVVFDPAGGGFLGEFRSVMTKSGEMGK